MARWSDPADALVALANVVRTVAPDAVLVVGMDGAGRGRECRCDCGLLRIELQSIDPQPDDGPQSPCGHLVMRATVTWTTCVPSPVGQNGQPPAPEVTTNASLGALRGGWKILRSLRSANDDAAWWRIVGMLPAGEANCEGVRIDVECDLTACVFGPDDPRSICT